MDSGQETPMGGGPQSSAWGDEPPASPSRQIATTLPVEVFEIIASHLTRAEGKALRLVCREFEAKVSPLYFRNVVVPFRSELYTNLPQDENGISTSGLFSNGMRMFESFGPHIVRFALSLELDEDMLASPPVKSTLKSVSAFWGEYDWPRDDYCRYHHLASIEQTADETDGMRAALHCLTKVNNLGLCCDAGLGFLHGPDTSARSAHCPQRPVFSTANWRQQCQLESAPMSHDSFVTVADFNNDLRQQTEPLPLNSSEQAMPDAGNLAAEAVQSQQESSAPAFATTGSPSTGSPHSTTSFEVLRGRKPSQPQLVPTSLTNAQKEMLLELEWAHRAMIQSYVLGVLDNASIGCFDNVTTFSVAKIPSCHVETLCRHDFWQAIPSLKNVSLGVIADWRRVTSTIPGIVDDETVSPVASVGQVFTLLDSFIGRYSNIESIHFEWICGGEFAPGVYQRNSYILPAPFFESADLMTNASAVLDNRASHLLRLPYAKHVSLKNCWSSPHVFLQMIRELALSSLEKLDLESVSLSQPPATRIQNAAFQLEDPASLESYAFLELMERHHPGGVISLAQILADSDSDPDFEGSARNYAFSWAALLVHFLPSVKMPTLSAEQLSQNQTSESAFAGWIADVDKYIPRAMELHHDKGNYRLRSLCFKSCGYVAVGRLLHEVRRLQSEARGSRQVNVVYTDLTPYMQRCFDVSLARINPHIERHEKMILRAFEMKLGWTSLYPDAVIADAWRDGVRPGWGRFSGLLEFPCIETGDSEQ